jgi:predicted amidohydrolase
MSVPKIDEVQLGLDWPKEESIYFWFLQPPGSGLRTDPPYYIESKAGRSSYKLLEAAIVETRKRRLGPAVVYLLPELAIAPDDLSNLCSLAADLPENHLLIAGLGHLTRDQCEQIEPGSSAPDRWDRDWGGGRYANAAMIAAKHKAYLQGKNFPSSPEKTSDVHMFAKCLRVFASSAVKLGVVICSEMLDHSGVSSFIKPLAEKQLDLLFWIQANERPRHPLFSQQIAEFFRSKTSNPLLVSVNVRPDEMSRAPFGGSSIFAPVECFSRGKENLARPYWVCEPACPGAARAVFVRYDSDAILVKTARPAGLTRDAPPERFLEWTEHFQFMSESLDLSNGPRHLAEILYPFGLTRR